MVYSFVVAAILQITCRVTVTAAFIGVSPRLERVTHMYYAKQEIKGRTRRMQKQRHAGVPPILRQLESAGDSILGYRKTESGIHNVTVELVSVAPPIFALRNFVTHDECKALQSTVSSMEPAQTASGLQEAMARKESFVAWLGNDKADGLVGRLADAVRRLMLVSKRDDPFLGVEDMQVVRYDPSGEYVLHHDGNGRILTVLYYLNGEGETWFPLAQTSDSFVRPQTRQEALDHAKGLKPGIHGLLVSSSCSTQKSTCIPVSQGDAVAFYSYFKDGRMDWSALHAGLPARNEKIVANHFFRYAES